ncbi:hypothetical protein GUJ93_ZPchr0013g37882 [Zizania palustris]|uniref:Uncharacterized protein n=1 Tax=Zizania palustris TaxID=103762 RepID=A0A8J5WXV4_ZIZPA|nr:hypothetical protein GUJ93_ZPchr0013g37882 [Zizania palustris]
MPLLSPQCHRAGRHEATTGMQNRHAGWYQGHGAGTWDNNKGMGHDRPSGLQDLKGVLASCLLLVAAPLGEEEAENC